MIKSYELHTARNRQALFASLPQKVWLETDLLRVWVVAEPQTCVDILRSPSVATVDLLTIVGHVEAAAGISLQNVRTANSYLPALLEGPPHAELRKALAKFLAYGLRKIELQLPELVQAALAPLTTPGTVDAYRDVTRPLVANVISVLIGQELTRDIQDLDLGIIFAVNKSPGKLRKLDADYGAALAFLARSSHDPMEVACKLCCLTFGIDTLTMTIIENILLALSDKVATEAAALPDYPIETGVPVTWRRALRDCEFGPHRFSAGDILRIQLQPLGYSDQTELKAAIFGAGIHSCVGKQLSLKIWSHLKDSFNGLGLRAEITEYELVPSHFIAHYRSVKIKVLP
jgi:cytochrome P450